MPDEVKKQYRIVEDIDGLFHLEVMVDRTMGFLWWKKESSGWLPITMGGYRQILHSESPLMSASPDNTTKHFRTKKDANEYLKRLIRGNIIHHANI